MWLNLRNPELEIWKQKRLPAEATAGKTSGTSPASHLVAACSFTFSPILCFCFGRLTKTGKHWMEAMEAADAACLPAEAALVVDPALTLSNDF